MSLWPGPRLITGALLFLGLGVLGAFVPAVSAVFVPMAAAAALVALVDLVIPGWARPLVVRRDAPENVAVGVPFEARLEVENHGSRARRVDVFEGVPEHCRAEEFPRSFTIEPGAGEVLTYTMTALRRGPRPYRALEVLAHSPLGLWRRRRVIDLPGSLRVLPNHRPVIRYNLLAVAHRMEQTGVRRRARRGMGTSFHQLRDYRDGDLPQQIDWKATARRRTVISREYEEERDQRVILLLDRSRRMSVRDGEQSLLDHALNASLLLSFVALEQGDRVGVVGFSGELSWIPPVKGPAGMPRILFGTHDWQTSDAPSDYFEAARRTLILERRRALVVLLTTLRGEDVRELTRAVEALSKRHLVVVASLREPAVAALAERVPQDFEEAVAVAGATHYESERRAVAAELRERGVRMLDVLPDALPAQLATAYLDAKQAGQL